MYTYHGGRVVQCRTCDREVAGSNPALGCCVPMSTQHAIPLGSVNEYQWKLGSKRAYHAIHWPRIRGLAASAGVWLRAKETEITAALWALEARERTLLYFYTANYSNVTVTPLCVFSVPVTLIMYCGGSPTTVQTWRTCPLWEPSPSHPILL